MKKRTNHGMWEYLDSLGVLVNGTDEEIKAAKKAYRKQYLLEYKRGQRNRKPEFTVNFSTEKGEYFSVAYAAKYHHMTITTFIHNAVLAYLNQRFVVPNQEQIANLEQVLAQCLNEIKSIVKPRERYFWEKDRKMEAIEHRIEKLEKEINQIFRNPPLIQNDSQSQNF